jgi:hypothetical protein
MFNIYKCGRRYGKPLSYRLVMINNGNTPYFDVVVGLVWSHDPKSYAGGSVCYW